MDEALLLGSPNEDDEESYVGVVPERSLNRGAEAEKMFDDEGDGGEDDDDDDEDTPRACCGCHGPFADETNRMFALAWPVAIGYLSTSAMTTVDLAFVGHLGREELAAMSVSNVILMGTFAVAVGVMGSLGPLGSQAFGAKQLGRMATWLQVSVFWPTLLFVPPLALAWAFSGDLMGLLGVQSSAAVTSLANVFGRWSLLWLWPAMLFNALSMWLEAMEVVWPTTIISIVFIAVNLGLNWLFVNGAGGAIPGFDGLGFVGSPVATAVSKALQILALWAWAFPVGGIARRNGTWRPWGRAMFDCRMVTTFLRMGVPMALTEAVFDWAFEILTGFSGALSASDVAAMGVLVNLLFLFQPLQMGIYTAVSIRVGNKLGDGSADKARAVARVGTLWGAASALAVGGLLWGLSPVVGGLFTSDDAVLATVAGSVPLLALDMTLSSLSFTAQGILEGQGRPELATYAALGGNWLVGLPAAWALANPLGMGLPGLWWGTIVGEVVHSVVLLVMAGRTDWEREVERADELAAADDEEAAAVEKALGGAGDDARSVASRASSAGSAGSRVSAGLHRAGLAHGGTHVAHPQRRRRTASVASRGSGHGPRRGSGGLRPGGALGRADWGRHSGSGSGPDSHEGRGGVAASGMVARYDSASAMSTPGRGPARVAHSPEGVSMVGGLA